MAFGLKQRNHPTPAKVNIIAGVITGALGAFIGWTGTNDIMSPKIENVFTSIAGLFLIMIPIIKPLFGVEVSGNTVPTDRVTAIDTDTKP